MKKINKDHKTHSQTISFTENSLLPLLYGEHDKFLRLIEQEMSISIITRGNFLKLSGDDSSVEITKNLLNHLYENVKKNNFLDEGEVKGTINIFRDSIVVSKCSMASVGVPAWIWPKIGVENG